MQITKTILVVSAAFAPFVVAGSAPTLTVTLQSVGADPSTTLAPTFKASPLPTAIVNVTPSLSAKPTSTPLWKASSSSIRASSTSAVPPAVSSIPPATGGAAPAMKLSGVVAGGVLAAAGLLML
ncbi:hypothetical protein EYZ11_006760 [Aspergillus tanneri]|uniref:Uncharacterized protein n=1 Tax=Aspergillus tanneri TaxID=1220188 RepID=A0A4S3JEY4_9EURO|nr:uncharacterized protein ATNIH1004_006967 [Aspergillus tanneri]KAA8645548.1 hypothetical protein ATNIH1004_006967 [Aspergillus tanneri]THC93752.1 hypothetical protein EYZ11_006760 [Aspergillus tanneri]